MRIASRSVRSKTARRALLSFAVAFGAFLAAACEERRAPEPASPRTQSAASPSSAKTKAPTPPSTPRFPPADRVVAIGDVHGALAATRAALRLAGAIGDGDRWIGGKLVLVQTGDQLDRGDDERAIVDLFDELAAQAREVGGAVHSLNGNHEVMNVAGDFRYVTRGGFEDFADVPKAGLRSGPFARMASQLPDHALGRAAAFFPGGPYALKLAERNTIAVVGDTVFAHGGVHVEHVDYGIERLNREVRDWMRRGRMAPPKILNDPDSPIWTRRYSDDAVDAQDCRSLDEALAALRAKRMVMGHTPQPGGVTTACDEKAWRIDVGMAAHYGGRPAALEITRSGVRVLTGDGSQPTTAASPSAGADSPAPAK